MNSKAFPFGPVEAADKSLAFASNTTKNTTEQEEENKKPAPGQIRLMPTARWTLSSYSPAVIFFEIRQPEAEPLEQTITLTARNKTYNILLARLTPLAFYWQE